MPIPPSGSSRRKWAEAERAPPAVACMAEAAMASSTRMARKEGGRTLMNQFTVPLHLALRREEVVGWQTGGAKCSTCRSGARE